MNCPFSVGDSVGWSEDAPSAWRFLLTPGSMTVVSTRFHDGTASPYAQYLTSDADGLCLAPGWIVRIEYDADATHYCDPPRSLLFHSATLQMEVHQMWLVAA